MTHVSITMKGNWLMANDRRIMNKSEFSRYTSPQAAIKAAVERHLGGKLQDWEEEKPS